MSWAIANLIIGVLSNGRDLALLYWFTLASGVSLVVCLSLFSAAKGAPTTKLGSGAATLVFTPLKTRDCSPDRNGMIQSTVKVEDEGTAQDTSGGGGEGERGGGQDPDTNEDKSCDGEVPCPLSSAEAGSGANYVIGGAVGSNGNNGGDDNFCGSDGDDDLDHEVDNVDRKQTVIAAAEESGRERSISPPRIEIPAPEPRRLRAPSSGRAMANVLHGFCSNPSRVSFVLCRIVLAAGMVCPQLLQQISGPTHIHTNLSPLSCSHTATEHR